LKLVVVPVEFLHPETSGKVTGIARAGERTADMGVI
jgi:hypothetical protein